MTKLIKSATRIEFIPNAPQKEGSPKQEVFVPIVDEAIFLKKVGDNSEMLGHYDVVVKAVEAGQILEDVVGSYDVFMDFIAGDLRDQVAPGASDEALAAEQKKCYSGWLKLLLETPATEVTAEATPDATAAAEVTEQASPIEETAQAITAAAEGGNPEAQKVVSQVEVIAAEAGVSPDMAMSAVLTLQSANTLAEKLLRSHVGRQQSFMQASSEDLNAIADFLRDSSTEIVGQLRAAANTALPEKV